MRDSLFERGDRRCPGDRPGTGLGPARRPPQDRRPAACLSADCGTDLRRNAREAVGKLVPSDSLRPWSVSKEEVTPLTQVRVEPPSRTYACQGSHPGFMVVVRRRTAGLPQTVERAVHLRPGLPGHPHRVSAHGALRAARRREGSRDPVGAGTLAVPAVRHLRRRPHRSVAAAPGAGRHGLDPGGGAGADPGAVPLPRTEHQLAVRGLVRRRRVHRLLRHRLPERPDLATC
jgi:hypothetical protein